MRRFCELWRGGNDGAFPSKEQIGGGNDGALAQRVSLRSEPSKEQISLLAHRIDQCAVLLFSDMALHRDQCNVRAGRERELDHTMQGALF